jgi:hypothetical protein
MQHISHLSHMPYLAILKRTEFCSWVVELPINNHGIIYLNHNKFVQLLLIINLPLSILQIYKQTNHNKFLSDRKICNLYYIYRKWLLVLTEKAEQGLQMFSIRRG